MTRWATALFLTAVLSSIVSHGQDNPDCYAEKDFLIILSTKDYDSALLTAQNASKALGIELDLRSLSPTNDALWGLTLPADTCFKYRGDLNDQKDSTCYIARGRYYDGVYISVEYSSAYQSFAPGYYIVMVYSSSKGDNELGTVLKGVQAQYPDAYIKTSKVYMCCSH
jgi:hypothetical protein